MVATLTRPGGVAEASASRAERLAQLEARLEKGWLLIEAGSVDPLEQARWEESWLRLLRQYEELYDSAA